MVIAAMSVWIYKEKRMKEPHFLLLYSWNLQVCDMILPYEIISETVYLIFHGERNELDQKSTR